ncbi:uncharacterized protein METZ01_LOCUS10445 [marine metagenome]|uniref:DUF4837 family protein n=1 Tax=marine metagenome TaxID=408172 RepID=A0A381NSM0_9ZZZZ
MRHTGKTVATILLASLLAACENPPAWGDQNAIIAITSDDQWAAVGEMVESALETTIVTVRAEKTFRVTHQAPMGQGWGNLQRFRKLLLIGAADSPWMVDALALSGRESFNPPEIFQVEDVWAKGQTATVLLLPSGGADRAEEMMEPLHELLDGQYRTYVLNRMFMSGLDSLLADTLWNEAGFTLLLPLLYERRTVDSVHIFLNDNPDPSELIRQITVTWRSPIPEELDEEELLAWREGLTERYFRYPQVVDLQLADRSRLQMGDLVFEELRAVWANPPEDQFPAGGPMITWSVPCPEQDRHYLVDAWLYAPGKDKYEYVLQLETILGTFRCRGAA